MAAAADLHDKAAAVERERVAVQVERDRARDQQGVIAVHGGDVVRERDGTAGVELALQGLP